MQTVMLTPLASPAQALLRSEGGEAAGLRRLQQYIWETNAVAHYADTRNGMASLPPVMSVLDPETEQAAGWLTAPPHCPANVQRQHWRLHLLSYCTTSIAVWCAGLLEADDSTKMGPWLALGCVSPRRMYHEVRRYEAERTSNDSARMVVLHLLVRDWFRCASWPLRGWCMRLSLCVLTHSMLTQAITQSPVQLLASRTHHKVTDDSWLVQTLESVCVTGCSA